MTAKEALEYFKRRKEQTELNDRVQQAEDLAIKALEKQMPKKPYDVDTEYKTFDCPECLSRLYTDDDMQDCGYCPVCGQRLDWRETE